MKALKITLAIMAIALLTVSGVQSDEIVAQENKIEKEKSHTTYDLLAHTRKKGAKVTNG